MGLADDPVLAAKIRNRSVLAKAVVESGLVVEGDPSELEPGLSGLGGVDRASLAIEVV